MPQPGVAVALEVQHDVDEVLEQPRPGDRAVLGDVADEHGRDAALLGHPDQRGRDLADLADVARRPVDLGAGDGLHRVDDQQVGLDRVDVAEDRGQVGLGGQEQVVAQCADAVGPQPHLGGGLLAGDVERASPLGEPRGHVEQQGRLAHARLAGHAARRRPGTMPPPSTRSSSLDPGRHGPRGLDVDLADRPGRRC